VPQGWKGRRVLLKFGAVDYRAMVWVNGRNLGDHLAFSEGRNIDVEAFMGRDAAHKRLVESLDAVFKLLFARPENRDLLVSLLTAVLRPPEPIVDFKFFKNKVFVSVLENNFIVFMAMMGGVFLVPIFAQTFLGYGATAADYDITVENRKLGAGLRIRGDQPLARLTFWTIRPTRSPEAFIQLRVEPGSESRWRISYEFYTLP
jgi:hypothetical protein